MSIRKLVALANCSDECRFQETPGMTTCAYYPPVYDKNGNNLNPDQNTTTFSIYCTKCGRSWRGSSCMGETTYEEMK